MRLPIYLNRTARVNSIPRLSSSTRPSPTKAACKHCFCQVHEIWVSKGAHLSSAMVKTLPAVMIGTKPESAQFSTRLYVKLKSGSELLIDKALRLLLSLAAWLTLLCCSCCRHRLVRSDSQLLHEALQLQVRLSVS